MRSSHENALHRRMGMTTRPSTRWTGLRMTAKGLTALKLKGSGHVLGMGHLGELLKLFGHLLLDHFATSLHA